MFSKPLSGPHAGTRKYDLLTALSILGLHGPRTAQVSVLRLLAIVTARYNWRANELSIGQAEMARIWGVTERTAKREVRSWLASGLVIKTRPASRGRVGAYRLDLAEIWHRSATHWTNVGPDYAERMAAENPGLPPAVDRVGPDVAPRNDAEEEADIPTNRTWRAVRDRIRRHNPAVYRHWIAPLNYVSDDGRCVTLCAPSRFAAHYVANRLSGLLEEAVEAEIGPLRRIAVLSDRSIETT